MGSVIRQAIRDVRNLLDVVERAVPACADEVFYSNVLAGLNELIPCWDITFQLMDLQRQHVWCTYLQGGVVMQDRSGRRTIGRRSRIHGCVLGRRRLCVCRSRGPTTRLFRWWSPAAEPVGGDAVEQFDHDAGIRHEVLVPMVPHGLIDRRLLLWRRVDEPAFTDRELLMLRMIRPHLAELHQRRHRELIGQPELTARQWEILRRVSTGASNHDVARALGVSDATVRKHLREHLPAPERGQPHRSGQPGHPVSRDRLIPRQHRPATEAQWPPDDVARCAGSATGAGARCGTARSAALGVTDGMDPHRLMSDKLRREREPRSRTAEWGVRPVRHLTW